MNDFFILCEESKIETNKSFYGRFSLGPFDSGQSTTVGNALRRTLLSDLSGIAITAVEIKGAKHEYCSLPGVRDSVLEIILNLKEIILKNDSNYIKPQLGYLRVRGPGIIRAKNLHLPSSIQCIDPNQYIATLAYDGVLDLKILIQYGSKWLTNNSTSFFEKKKKYLKAPSNILEKELQQPIINNPSIAKILMSIKNLRVNTLDLEIFRDRDGDIPENLVNWINFNYKKKILISNTLKNINSKTKESYIQFLQKEIYIDFLKKKLTKSIKFHELRKKITETTLKKFKKTVFSNLKALKIKKLKIKNQKKYFRLLSKTKDFVSSNQSNPIYIDAIFNPINKVNFIIEIDDYKSTGQHLEQSQEMKNLYDIFYNNTDYFASFQSNTQDELKLKLQNKIKTIQTSKFYKENKKSLNPIYQGQKLDELKKLLELISQIQTFKNDYTKHTITLEIWTNGSLHPRDAIYQAFKKLTKLFSKLENIKSILSDFNPLQISLTKNPVPKLLTIKKKENKTGLNLIKNDSIFRLKNKIKQDPFLTTETPLINDDLKKKNISSSNIGKQNNFLKMEQDISELPISLRCYSILKRLRIKKISELLIFLNQKKSSIHLKQKEIIMLHNVISRFNLSVISNK